MTEPNTIEELFKGAPLGAQVADLLRREIEALGVYEFRVSRTQVAFRRRRGFAYVWQPGRWLKSPTADAVVSIALSRRIESRRFKEIVHPSNRTWMHHLEVHRLEDIDEEVKGWLRQAYEDAA
jgi:hypothetical protein